ncbi:MAG: hypoxanthine phosphoribosyltransferase [Clostridioides sp.]|jgi:hypoxanthine phosphoribosyltransferase|nr:hypoxanthine phosphoribosyltransferase [Clostridioides sp.]
MYKLKETLISEEEIKAKVKEMGKKIEEDYKGEEVLLVGILKGASIFAADLVRSIDLDVKIDFMSVSSYGNSTQSSNTVKILKDLDTDIKGRNVLIVEDIIDTGLTLSNLVAALKTRKPKSLKLCTLIDKPARRTTDILVDYKGFVIEDKFIVGYGLDYAERFRNLPFIGILEDTEE